MDPVERARRELDVGLEAPRGMDGDALRVEVARVEVALVRDGVEVASYDLCANQPLSRVPGVRIAPQNLICALVTTTAGRRPAPERRRASSRRPRQDCTIRSARLRGLRRGLPTVRGGGGRRRGRDWYTSPMCERHTTRDAIGARSNGCGTTPRRRPRRGRPPTTATGPPAAPRGRRHGAGL